MANVITSKKTYATVANATTKLTSVLSGCGLVAGEVRWLIAVGEDGRFVPTVLVCPKTQPLMAVLANNGIMVIG